MSRSPYSAPRRNPRWPWYAGALAIIAVIALTGVVASTGAFTDDRSAVDRLAQNQPTATAGPPQATATDVPEPTAASAPTSIPEDSNAPVRTAEAWFSLWAQKDYAGMYRLTGNTTRTLVSEAEFVDRYQAIESEAGIKSVSGTLTGDVTPEGRFPYEATFESSLLGTYSETNGMLIVPEDGEWRIAWTPSLIFEQLGETGCIHWQGEPVQRGRILDADGDVLAEDAEVSQVGVVPGQLADDDATINSLGEIIDMDPDDIRSVYQREGTGANWFVPVKNLPAGDGVSLLNQVKGMSGVTVKSGFSRVYPMGELFAHVTGYVSPATAEDVQADDTGSVQASQMVGRAGLESGANEILSGKPGGKLSVVECETRQERAVITESKGVQPLDITITIDADFQKQVDAAVTNVDQLASVPSATKTPGTSEEKDQARGAAVVIDPQTGAILAMVSRPSYDPNLFVSGSFTDDQLEYLNDPELRPQANRATRETYPAGSIFKVITTSAAMADLGYTGETQINCPASFSIGNVTWNDWVVENGLSAQGELNLHSGLVQSCNTVFYQIGAKLDNQDPHLLPKMAKSYGLGSPTGIDYYPEGTGVVPDPEWKLENISDGWATGDSVNLSIGQGYLLVTPLQMANAYASIANGGDVMKPYLVDTAHVPGTDLVQQVGKREVVRELPLDDAEIAELQSALREQTSNNRGVGSSRIFADFGWPISGKTGTAQNGPQDGSTKPHSWFAAYGPGDSDATIASVVMFEQVGEGVQYAAPVTREIYKAYISSDLASVQP